jgi:GTPase SAR1 family protein
MKDMKQAPQKLILLGAGLAGKSTIFKQVAIIYSTGFDEKQKANYKPAVFANVIEGIKTLIHEAQKRDQKFTKDGKQKSADVMKLKLDDVLNESIGEMIHFLWTSEPAIQVAYGDRSQFGLGDGFSYMLDNVQRICQEGYTPTDDDIVRVRVRTSSIVEMSFKINGVDFLIADVGGQRGERRKWIHCFDGVQAVLFVAAISEYDQKVVEDPEKNSLIEAIELFGNVCNLPTFKKTAMILFLNKSDIFKDKMKNKMGNLQDVFPEYDGGYNSKTAIEYIIQQFEAVRENPEKVVFTHVTCATNKDNIQFVFEAVKEIVVKQNLETNNLI